MLPNEEPARALAGEPIRFGKYWLLERISIGGMAEVWRAVEREGAGRVVAIKRLLPSVAEHAELVSMFIAEGKIMLELHHPHIARVYELGEWGNEHFISMEYVRGKDLRKVLDRCRRLRHRLAVPLTCHVIAQLCEALDFAHRSRDPTGCEANLVHRDVSPANVLLGFAGEVKLIDFGIAQVGEYRPERDPPNGKRAYMSPEQARGLALDRRSDVFSVGVCLYEMLTGERPGHGPALGELPPHIASPSEGHPEVPPPLQQIVFKALATDPESRYQYASELAADLQRFLRQSHFEAKDLVTYMQSSFSEGIETEEEVPRVEESASPIALLPRALALGPLLGNALAPPSLEAPAQRWVEEGGSAPVDRDGPGAPTPRIWSPPLRVSDAVRASVRAFAEPGAASKTEVTESKSEIGEDRRELLPSLVSDPLAAARGLGAADSPTPAAASAAGEGQVSASATPLAAPPGEAGVVQAPDSGTPPPTAGEASQAHGPAARASAIGKGKAIAFGMAGAALVSALAVAAFFVAQEANTGFLSLDVPADLKGKHLVVAFRGEPLRVPEQGKLTQKVKAGPGLLTVQADGYQPSTRTLEVKGAHEITEVTARLAPVVGTALLAVVAEPEDAAVRVDGNLVAPSGGVAFYLTEIPVGVERLVQVRRAGYESFESRVKASSAGEQVKIRAKLRPLDYSLSVSSSPAGALVFANGARLGRTPMDVRLAPNTTELTVRKRCYEPVQVPLSSPGEASEPVPIHVSMKRLPSCR